MFCVLSFSETAPLCPDSPGRLSCQDKHSLVQKHVVRSPDFQLFGFGHPDDSKSRRPCKEDDQAPTGSSDDSRHTQRNPSKHFPTGHFQPRLQHQSPG